MRLSPLACVLFCATSAQAAVVHVPLTSNLVLKPDQTYTVTIDATEPLEIGWQAIQAKPCTTNCVQETDRSGGSHYSIATPLGASKKYTPVSGKIVIEYKNVSAEPVTINVYRVERTCEAEACQFLDEHQKARWLVFKVDEFTSISTSKDASYSIISGVAMGGRRFTFKAVWWTDDKTALGVNCAGFVKRYLDNRTPKEQYRPYVISGQAIGEPSNILLKSVDSCAPKAWHYGVPESNVFK